MDQGSSSLKMKTDYKWLDMKLNMTIPLTRANLRKLVNKMKEADPELMREVSATKENAIAEFGRVHFPECFDKINLDGVDDEIMETTWLADVASYTINGVFFDEKEVRTILRLNSPHR